MNFFSNLFSLYHVLCYEVKCKDGLDCAKMRSLDLHQLRVKERRAIEKNQRMWLRVSSQMFY